MGRPASCAASTSRGVSPITSPSVAPSSRAQRQAVRTISARGSVFFFKQKTAYELGLGIPAEPLFRSATCDDKSAQIYARFDKNDWRIQPAEFYRFHDAEVNTFGYF